MSDQNGSFPLKSIGQEEGLEFAAIFGGGTSENNTNPFGAMMTQQAETIVSPIQPQTVEGTPSQEAPAHILWDKEAGEFTVHVPRQSVSKARIDADLSRDMPPEERYIHYADIRSHEAMAGGFEEKLLAMSANIRYRLLNRLRIDCDYYLGEGNRQAKHLYTKDVRTHISAMKTLWNSFPEDQAPKWLSFEDILDYETQMTGEET